MTRWLVKLYVDANDLKTVLSKMDNVAEIIYTAHNNNNNVDK